MNRFKLSLAALLVAAGLFTTGAQAFGPCEGHVVARSTTTHVGLIARAGDGRATGTSAQVSTKKKQPHTQCPLSPVQVAQRNRGYGAFITFGINTFNETEWSDGRLPVESYNPTGLDCDQWVRVVKEAGFRYVLLTTKHHDGFCLWDSAYTEYDVASSPVKTDVVAEVAKACRKYGVELKRMR